MEEFTIPELPSAETTRRRLTRGGLAVGIAAAVAASAFGAVMLAGHGRASGASPTAQQQSAAAPVPVQTEQAGVVGHDPFLPSPGTDSPAVVDGSSLPGTPGTDSPAVVDSPSLPGTPGTEDLSHCDPARLVSYLAEHPAAAVAWTEALDRDPSLRWREGNRVGVDQIGAYVAQLTPVVLGQDRRVTNYFFLDGRPVAFQSDLQPGTAVLVDSEGTPRVRCACGNPLNLPVIEPPAAGRPAAEQHREPARPVVVAEPDRAPRHQNAMTVDGNRPDNRSHDDVGNQSFNGNPTDNTPSNLTVGANGFNGRDGATVPAPPAGTNGTDGATGSTVGGYSAGDQPKQEGGGQSDPDHSWHPWTPGGYRPPPANGSVPKPDGTAGATGPMAAGYHSAGDQPKQEGGWRQHYLDHHRHGGRSGS